MKKKSSLKTILIWLAVALFVVGYLKSWGNNKESQMSLRFSDFVSHVKQKKVKEVVMDQYTLSATYKNDEKFLVTFPIHDHNLVRDMLDNGVGIKVSYEKESFWLSLLLQTLPFLLYLAVVIYLNSGSSMKGPFGLGRSKLKKASDNTKRVTFNDVAGLPEAKEDLMEIVNFLKNPKQFSEVGAKIPKGVLLYGPPGTGKTLLARAIAGEAGVPFFFASASEFVEIFVGVGASRVRDMFSQARKAERSIIFIDELDSIGKKRGQGSPNDERENTLNQVLVEMDGFAQNSGTIVLGATNRIDVLDGALLRPGRFDRSIQISLPDLNGRKEILKVHLKNVETDPNGLNLKNIVEASIGMSGADLANIVNEAAIIAGKEERKFIVNKDLINATEKIILGGKSSIVMAENERKLTAYHEAGHAIISLFTKDEANPQNNCDPIYKVTIIPTGKALGMVVSLPEKDVISKTKARLLNSICVLMGGRAAEEIIFGKENATSGASSDIDAATSIARRMVCEWGMTDKIGQVKCETNSYLDRPSESLMEDIDKETRRIVNEQFERAKSVIQNNFDKFELLALELLKRETLTGDEVRHLIEFGNLDDIKEKELVLEEDYLYINTSKNEKAKLPLEDTQSIDED